MLAYERTASPPPTSTDRLLLEILERLAKLEAKINRVQAATEPMGTAAAAIPPAIAGLTDAWDAWARQAQAQGIDLDARMQALGRLATRLSEPSMLKSFETLLGLLPDGIAHVQALPMVMATLVDSFDAWVRSAAERGLDVEVLLGHMGTIALQLSEMLQSPQFKALMSSGVLNPETLAIIGQAGQALVETRAEPPPSLGLFGVLKALQQPEMQKALGFFVTFANRFGQSIGTKPHALPEPKPH